MYIGWHGMWMLEIHSKASKNRQSLVIQGESLVANVKRRRLLAKQEVSELNFHKIRDFIGNIFFNNIYITECISY